MHTALVIVIIVVVIGAIIGFSILNKRKADKREKDLAAWAQWKGLNLRPGNDREIDYRYRQFKCLQHGENRYGFNITEGTIGNKKICAFDYHYETHSTNSKGQRQTSHHYFSAVVVEIDLPLKPLFIRTENFLDKMTEFIGFNDIDFESTEFSKQFYVKSPDKKWAYDVLHQATMELLLKSPRFKLEFENRKVIAYRDNTFPVADFDAALNLINDMLDNLPASLVQELKGVK